MPMEQICVPLTDVMQLLCHSMYFTLHGFLITSTLDIVDGIYSIDANDIWKYSIYIKVVIT